VHLVGTTSLSLCTAAASEMFVTADVCLGVQQWGGDDEEGVGQAEKEGGERERRLKVLGEDLTAEELKEVLQVSCVTHFQTMLFPCCNVGCHAMHLCKARQHCIQSCCRLLC